MVFLQVPRFPRNSVFIFTTFNTSHEISGPTPDVDIVLSVCLESDLPTVPLVKSGATPAQVSGGPVPTTSDLSGSSKSHAFSNSSLKHTRDKQSGKRKDYDSMSFHSYLHFPKLWLLLSSGKKFQLHLSTPSCTYIICGLCCLTPRTK